MKPEEIEALSFKIIDKEAPPHNFPPDQWSIVRRMIHTSADLIYGICSFPQTRHSEGAGGYKKRRKYYNGYQHGKSGNQKKRF